MGLSPLPSHQQFRPPGSQYDLNNIYSDVCWLFFHVLRETGGETGM